MRPYATARRAQAALHHQPSNPASARARRRINIERAAALIEREFVTVADACKALGLHHTIDAANVRRATERRGVWPPAA